MVFFDIESTIDAFKQTLEVAAVSEPSGNVFQTMVAVDSYQHAGYRLGTRIHGITPDMIRKAPSFPVAIDWFITFLEAEARNGGLTLVAHNGRVFDMRVLTKQCGRHGINLHERLQRAGVTHFLDTHPLFQKLKQKGVVPTGRLIDLYVHYTGRQLDGAHRALADARALRKVCEHVEKNVLEDYTEKL